MADMMECAEEMASALRIAERSLAMHNHCNKETPKPCDWDFGEGHGGSLDIVRAALSRYEASK